MGSNSVEDPRPYERVLAGERHEHSGAYLMRSISRVSQELNAEMSRVMLLNDLDMRAMAQLMEFGPITIGELAKRLGISKALASVVVDRLEIVGHGRRERDAPDRRRVLIHAEPNSAQGAMTMLLPVIIATDQAYKELDQHGQAAVDTFLTATLKAMEARLEDIKKLPAPPKKTDT